MTIFEESRVADPVPDPRWEGLNPPYATIVADPPWFYRQGGPTTGFAPLRPPPYSMMGVGDIAALDVDAIAAADAHLYLWVTVPKLWDSPTPAEIAAAWGFTYKTLLTWVKGERVGIGWYYRVDTEHVAFCTRGSAPIPGELRESSVLWSPRGGHSAKPAAFADRVESVSPGPYVELFARAPRLGWDSWGLGYESERVS